MNVRLRQDVGYPAVPQIPGTRANARSGAIDGSSNAKKTGWL